MTTMKDLPTSHSAAARAAFTVAQHYASPSLLNHAQRSQLWAEAYAVVHGVDHDTELLYVAALLHDLGLEVAFDNHELPFEEAGGQVAWVFGVAAGWSPARCRRVSEIIVRHMWDDLDVATDPESWLLIRATSLDISGRYAAELPETLRAEVVTAIPRLSLASDFARCFEGQARRKPQSAAADAVRSGIAGRLAQNPLENLGGSQRPAHQSARR